MSTVGGDNRELALGDWTLAAITETTPNAPLPVLKELGVDLLHVSAWRRCASLSAPFAFAALYFVFALRGAWSAAVACAIILSFLTYGSISHDLVHRNLGLPRWANDLLLCLIELLAIRSGHAYRRAHFAPSSPLS